MSRERLNPAIAPADVSHIAGSPKENDVYVAETTWDMTLTQQCHMMMMAVGWRVLHGSKAPQNPSTELQSTVPKKDANNLRPRQGYVG